jgi:hypothetical protein
MVIDVESVGLHGEAFAVGYIVIDDLGNCIEEDVFACDPAQVVGASYDYNWVKSNMPELPITHISAVHMRDRFWWEWLKWREKGATLWADCGWPVEARFLMACIDADRYPRNWAGPYPLHEIATLLLARGLDPLTTFSRLPDELPEHNPLMDARQSARVLHALLTGREKDIA